MRNFIRQIFLVIILLFFTNDALSLEKPTHEFINKTIANQSWLNNYLKTNLGFEKGIEERFDDKRVFEWVAEGGIKEDEPMNTRSFDHFHDPLKTWSSAGFKGTFKSSIIWSQDQGAFGSLFGGDWSWKKARDSFYKGLTGITKTEREKNLADTFRALGQVMHLVQDASVPAHVRNDTHVYLDLLGTKTGGFHYEIWIKNNHSLLNLNPLSFDQSILNLIPESSAPIPIANIFDTNRYNGLNPNVATGSNIGLTEFTNANFFSEGTIFKDYPHPTKENTNAKLIEQIAKDGKKDKVWYIQGYTSERLAAYSYLWNYSNIIPKKEWLYNLNNYVYAEYASQLIPRAVGYSAGLLNYFFRGEIDMVPDDATGSDYVIVNNTDEDMNGIFELWYDNKSDQRVKAWNASLSIGKKSSGNNKSTNITFDPPTDAKESAKYMLVFRGKLGNEEDAVVGKEMNLTRDFLFFVKAFPVWTNVGNGWIDVWKTLVFEIKTINNQYQLAPISKNINFTVWNSPSTHLTVQSNPGQTEHTVALPWRYGNRTTYEPNIAKYGGKVHYFTDYLGYDHYFTIGFPQAYIPKNFNDEKSPYVWDSDFTYGEWVSKKSGYYTYWRPASYIHGRRPFKVVDNKLVAKNINTRKSDPYTYYGDDYSGPFHIQYKDETGKWIRGIDLPTSGVNHLAVLDRDKTIYIKTDASKSSQPSSAYSGNLKQVVTTTYTFVNNFCNRTYTIRSTWSYTIADYGSNSTSSTQSKLVIGDTILKEFISRNRTELSGVEPYISDYVSSEEKVSDSNPDCWLYDGQRKITSYTKEVTISGDTVTRTIQGKPYKSFVGKSMSNLIGDTLTKVLGYDHINGDESYILFYEYLDNSSQSNSESITEFGVYGTGNDARLINSDQGLAELIQSFGWDGHPPHYKEQTSITKTGYVLVYKIGSILEKIDLNISLTNSYSYNGGWSTLNIKEDGYSYECDCYSTENRTIEGQRITGVSSQINDKNIVYTYIVENETGTGNTENWEFSKRIIGIINIANGHRQEFEITEANASGFLTDIYKDYDYKDLAAIGVHREAR